MLYIDNPPQLTQCPREIHFALLMTSSSELPLVVIGGGPAGFFAAIASRQANSSRPVIIIERGKQPMAKLAASGGGRCNLTNANADHGDLRQAYPRGGRELRGAFSRFGVTQTREWFESHNVALVVEADGRVFPRTQRAATVVDCLRTNAAQAGVKVRMASQVLSVSRDTASGVFHVGVLDSMGIDAVGVIVCTGGGDSSALLTALGHSLVPTVPALFGFRVDRPTLTELAGLSAPDAEVRIEGHKARSRGAVLVTHEGLSGPAVLRLSSIAARELAECSYQATLRVNWLASMTEEEVLEDLAAMRDAAPRARVVDQSVGELPVRLWKYLAVGAGISPELTWANLSVANQRALAVALSAGALAVSGRSVNKDEFVTAGGVSLREVDMRTLESRIVPGLHFAGEVLDIDGVTGGYNLQAAWTTAYLAGTHASGAEPIDA